MVDERRSKIEPGIEAEVSDGTTPGEIELPPLFAKAHEAMKKAVEEAIQEHWRAGRPVQIWDDGKVVELYPDGTTVPPQREGDHNPPE